MNAVEEQLLRRQRESRAEQEHLEREGAEGAAWVGHKAVEIARAAPATIAAAPGAMLRGAEAAYTSARDAIVAAPGEIVNAAQRAGHWAVGKISEEFAPAAPAAHPNHAAPHPAAHAGPRLPHAQSVPGVSAVAVKGTPFLKARNEADSVAPSDIVQGEGSDCWLLAALAAIARANPQAIHDIIKTVGPNLYEVTLYTGAVQANGLRAPEKFVVDNTFPKSEHHAGAKYARPHESTADGFHELWPLLIEKAFAIKHHGYDGFFYLNQGLTARLDSAIGDLLPNGAKGMSNYDIESLTENQVLAHVEEALRDHRPITSRSAVLGYVNDFGVVDNHHYAVSGVDMAKRTVSLQNPWGDHHINNMPIANYVICFTELDIGPAPQKH